MKKAILFYIFIMCAILSNGQQTTELVNVFTGTSNSRWMLFPGATMPFGMVKLSPDNQQCVWNGGYEYTISSISGFSHFHSMGLGGLSLMPATGNLALHAGQLKTFPGPADGPFGHMWTAGYRSRFRKSDEEGSPGYYSVYLYDYNIKAELTATKRCGMLRFSYPETEKAHIIINFNFPNEELYQIHETYAEGTNDHEIVGYKKQSNQYAEKHTVYFVLQMNKSFKSIDGWETEKYEGEDKKYGTVWRQERKKQKDIETFNSQAASGIILHFSTEKNEKIIVRTGVSLVSIANARKNLEQELIPMGWDFEKVRSNAEKTWNELLSTAEVEGTNKADLENFYTCFYRAYTGKGIISDVDGSYTDMCEEAEQCSPPADVMYTGDGFWGSQWNLAPLWSLFTPQIANSFANFFLEAYDQGGWIPEAPVGLEYAPIMGAQHHNTIIISAYQKGIRNFDVQKAYKAIKHDYTTPGIAHECGGYAGNRHLASYLEYGYVPEEAGAVSNTMEYAFDDWAFAQFAKALNKEKDYTNFMNRSKNYKNVFDPETKYIRRKHKDGTWASPFDPFKMGTEGGWNGPGYMEGNAWIYTFFVPHDLNGLISLMGKETFIKRAEEGFTKGYFDLSNQPSLHAPYLFIYAGKPWLTQKYTRYMLDEMFNTSPMQGWEGEEDEGQMSAMFVLMSMGLFQVDGGCSTKPYYLISSPLFNKVTIHLDDQYYSGNDLIIEAKNNSEKNIYIQNASFNGKPLDGPWIYHENLIKGGILKYEMGSKPNKKWGKNLNNAPFYK